MRIFALGAGEMGRAATLCLAKDDRVDAIVVGDRDEAAASRVAHSAGVKARSLAVDVTDRQGLADALRDCDVVVNTVGPFFRFGATVLGAAIESGCDYIDICDDPEPTLEMLELDNRARTAGVTALVGMGASPGVSNLLAVVAARELDSVDAIHTCWNVAAAQPDSPPTGSTSAALVHGIRQISGEIPVIHDGRLTRRPALEHLAIDYPGIGPIVGRSFGHPEAVTLSRAFPELRVCQNVVFGDRVTLTMLSALRWSTGHRILTTDRAARLAAWIERHNSAGNTLVQAGGVPPLFALATGTHQGHRAVVATALTQLPGMSMAANTAVPLAVATPMLKAAARPGVHTPETLVDPVGFFDAFAGECIGNPRPEAMVATTRSWASADENAAVLGSHLLTALLHRH